MLMLMIMLCRSIYARLTPRVLQKAAMAHVKLSPKENQTYVPMLA